MFLLYYLVFRSRKCLGKILLMSGPLFEKIFGSELLFFGVGVGRVFFCAVLPMFLLYYVVFFAPDNVSRKFSLCQVLCFWVFWIGCPEFFGEVFRALKCPIFAAQQRHLKSSPLDCLDAYSRAADAQHTEFRIPIAGRLIGRDPFWAPASGWLSSLPELRRVCRVFFYI